MAFEPVSLHNMQQHASGTAIRLSGSGKVLWLSRGLYDAFPVGTHVQPMFDAESSTLRLGLASSGLKVSPSGSGRIISFISVSRTVDIPLGKWIDGVLTTDQDGNTVADFVIPRVGTP